MAVERKVILCLEVMEETQFVKISLNEKEFENASKAHGFVVNCDEDEEKNELAIWLFDLPRERGIEPLPMNEAFDISDCERLIYVAWAW